jgi:hypothetical protein
MPSRMDQSKAKAADRSLPDLRLCLGLTSERDEPGTDVLAGDEDRHVCIVVWPKNFWRKGRKHPGMLQSSSEPELLHPPISNALLDNIRQHRRQALADLADFTRKVAALHDDRYEAPFEVASAIGHRYVHHALVTEKDLEAAVMNVCSANGSCTPIRIRNQIKNGLRFASNDTVVARLHRGVLR